MKAAFIHDHYFVYNKEDKKVYDGSGGVFDYKLWKRYLAVFDSLIVVGRRKDDLPNKLIDSTYENVSFELRDELKSGKDRFFKKNLIKKEIEKTLRKVDFAIIRLPSTLGYIAQEVCEENKIKYTLEIVACPWDAYTNYGNISGKIIAPIEYFKLKTATKNAPACIYVTKHFLQKRYPTRCNSRAISNVNISEVIDKEKAIDFYRSYSVGQEFKIALIGSFHVKYKGHVEAIKALSSLKNQYNILNIKLYFVGTGDAGWVREYANELGVGNSIEIVGTLKAGSEGILPFLDGVHLYIHPSKQEGLPRVVIEALSRGRISLGSTAAGIPELLDKEFLHRPGDWKKLAEDIRRIYTDSLKWDRIILSNLSKAEEYLEDNLQQIRFEYLKQISNA
ncbi:MULTISPECIES: glycosyltransferase [unclassified Sphingobacterium]|uniref:glycosyltransferase n=1 Tax=unclassified Sphingobacterium TaxID=2609468 RepID=UPI0025E0B7BC|nr:MULTISPECIES: glycosyltransferase [unclassified Sphingobacterium]